MDETQFEKLLLSLGERRMEHRQSAFERHAQTAFTGLAVILLSGVAGGLWQMHGIQNKLVTGQTVQTLVTQNLADKIERQTTIYAKQVDFLIQKQNTDRRLLDLENFLNKKQP